jgi:hypothetical protein
VGPGVEIVDVGAEVHVIGTPTWMRSATGASYRESPMLPVFGKGSRLHVGGGLEVKRESAWNVWVAGIFAFAATTVGVVQVLER